MANITALSIINAKTKIILVDILALAFITFVPALSHLLAIPFYLLEPMRIMLVISIVHTSKRNSFILAAALPIFSILISTHPSLFKTVLIISELALNVWLFFYLTDRFKNYTAAIFSSILLCKLYYYIVKYAMINFSLIDGELIATPLYLQAVVAVILSIYVYLVFRKDRALTR